MNLRKPKTWTELERQAISERYSEEGPNLLALEFRRSRSSITNQAAILGIRSKNWRRRLVSNKATNSQSVDIHYFDSWSQKTAFTVGYLWADGGVSGNPRGSVRTISMNCLTSDEDVLLHIHSDMNSKHKITRTPSYRDGHGNYFSAMTRTHITNSFLVGKLMELSGMEPNKSNKDLNYKSPPLEFLPYFVHGYHCGDGSVSGSAGSFRILGSYRFLEQMQKSLCDLLGLPKNQIMLGEGCNEIAWAAKSDLRIIYSWLYRPDSPNVMRRKREALERLL